MNKKIWMMLPLLLVACAPHVNRMDDTQRVRMLRFGDWAIAPANPCEILGNSADVMVRTDGKILADTINLRLGFASPLAGMPRANLSSYTVTLPLEGAHRDFGLTLLYDSTTAAHLLQTDTFLTIQYQPLSEGTVREVNFGTRGLVHAMAYVGAHC